MPRSVGRRDPLALAVLAAGSIPCGRLAGRRGAGRGNAAQQANNQHGNVQVTTSGNFGISLTHTTGVTIENSTITGQNPTTGRVNSAIDDVYGDSTAITIKDNNISAFRTAIQISTGLIEGNYIHDPGYLPGDHTNGIYVNGGTQPLTIQDNFLAGGSYTIYGGAATGSPTTAITIKNNRFGQLYYPHSGQYGPVSYYDPTATGNTWTGNTWDTTGQTIPSP